jgi:hypothetical protein
MIFVVAATGAMSGRRTVGRGLSGEGQQRHSERNLGGLLGAGLRDRERRGQEILGE